jgi:hypothetical protein
VTAHLLDLRARWSMADVARALGEFTKDKKPNCDAARRAMRDNGVPLHQSGPHRKCWVLLSELKLNWPTGWASICDRIALLGAQEKRRG